MTDKEIQQIASMTNEELAAAERVFSRQTRAPIFVGDRDRSAEVLEAI
jgi:hypothetical protein